MISKNPSINHICIDVDIQGGWGQKRRFSSSQISGSKDVSVRIRVHNSCARKNIKSGIDRTV